MRITIYIFFLILMLFNNSFGQPGKRRETIIIRTELGEIHARLDLRRAPATSLNFLRYVDADMFDSASFYRVVRMDNQPRDSVKIEVIQGGRNKDEDNVNIRNLLILDSRVLFSTAQFFVFRLTGRWD
jgi:cyclophilin family peptidyl-prolyl cis-trans isomerase